MTAHAAVDVVSSGRITRVGIKTMHAAAEALKKVSLEHGGEALRTVIAGDAIRVADSAVEHGIETRTQHMQTGPRTAGRVPRR